jgi:hypothetical protein
MVKGLERGEIVLLHFKAIRKLVRLKMLVNFLICGDEQVNVAHFV